MFSVKGVPGFTFPYPVEYLFTGAILVGIASVIVVGVVIITVESTVPHIKKSIKQKMRQYQINHMTDLERRIYDDAVWERENDMMREYHEAGAKVEVLAKLFEIPVEEVEERLAEETASWLKEMKERKNRGS